MGEVGSGWVQGRRDGWEGEVGGGCSVGEVEECSVGDGWVGSRGRGAWVGGGGDS